MLTEQLLSTNVTGLTPEQVTRIIKLSKDDEDIVIGNKFKEINDRNDAIIKEVTGVDRGPNEKSSDYLSRVTKELKSSSGSSEELTRLKGQITTLTAERDELNKKITSGKGDEALKGQLTALQQQLKDKDDEIALLKTSFETKETEMSQKLDRLSKIGLSGQMDSFIVDKEVSFKGTIPKDLLNETLKNRKAAILSKIETEEMDDGNGGKITVVRKGGVIQRDEKSQAPVTVGQYYLNNISDLIDPGKKQEGGGTKPGGSGGGSVLDLSSAKTKVEADEAIKKHLIGEGIARGTAEFTEKSLELRKENNVDSLPNQ